MSSPAWRDDDLVTGEAVVLQVPPAGLGLRLASGAIDVGLRALFLAAALITLFSTAGDLDTAALTGLTIVFVVGALVLWPAAIETLSGGRTLGKRLVGLRTVRDDGGRIDLRRALTRHLVGFVEIWALLGWPALIAGATTRRATRLGDIAAGTFVARDRVTLPLPEPVPMPPGLEAWAAGADIGRLPHDLVAQLRYLLDQGDQFTPEARERTELALVEALQAHVTPPPPPGTGHTGFIRAVLAERRRRQGVRLAADERRRRQLFGSLPG